MAQMMFIPKLKQFLRLHNTIYTVRRYDYLPGPVYVSDLGLCSRVFVKRVEHALDLEEYVPYSGFNDRWSWWSMVMRLAKDGPYYLYKVEVVNKD